jgi:predicted RNA-binding protein YlqC (UPF0109 family)
MNANELRKLTDLIRAIVAGIVAKEDAIEIASQPATGSCYWMMRVAPEDDSKAIGKDGAHARALALLIDAWGRAENEVHTFRLINNEERIERPPDKPRDVMSFDTTPARELLSRVLSNLSLDGFAIDVGPGSGIRDTLTFMFTIRVATDADHRELLRPRNGRGRENTLIAAIGTLFRAIARKNGVAFELVVEAPAARAVS